MLQRLWRHRVFVALGVVVAAVIAVLSVSSFSLSPLAIEPKRAEFGAAQTTIYIDTERGSVATSQEETAGLTARAQIFARFINSGAVRTAAAEELGVPATAIVVTGPSPDQAGQTNVQPAAQQRANQLISPASPYSVFVDTEQNAPTITLFTQARTAEGAIRLAGAVTTALRGEIRTAQRQAAPELEDALRDQLRATQEREDRSLSAAERRQARRQFFESAPVIKRLGDPVGGPVEDETGKAVAGLVFVVIVLVWCVGVLLLSGAARAVRRR